MGIFAYYDTDTDGIVYYVPPSTEPDYASTLRSETESVASATTIESDDLPGFFVLCHGRQHPASDNAPKWFPADNVRRHVVRYVINKWRFGADYLGPVGRVLAPVEGRERCALELGTRTGTWIQTMATQFPHVHFTSLDLAPVIAHAPRANVVFEVYDFTEGLQLENESQDAVFLSNVFELVRDYRALLREVYRVLRPGGLIHVIEFSPRMWDPEDPRIPAWQTDSRWQRLIQPARGHLASLGLDLETCEKLPEWLLPGSSLWDPTIGQGGFAQIQSVMRTHPIYPHSGRPCMNGMDPGIAPLLMYAALSSIRDIFGFLKDSGMDGDEAESLIEEAIERIKQHEKCSLAKLYCVYAIKL